MADRSVATRLRGAAALLAALALAGCGATRFPTAGPPGSCTRYDSALHLQENVPECELRGPDTLINGLPPSYPGDRS